MILTRTGGTYYLLNAVYVNCMFVAYVICHHISLMSLALTEVDSRLNSRKALHEKLAKPVMNGISIHLSHVVESDVSSQKTQSQSKEPCPQLDK